MKGYKFQKYSFRATTEYKPYKFLTIRLLSTDRDATSRAVSIRWRHVLDAPLGLPYDEEGNLVPNRYSGWVNSQ